MGSTDSRCSYCGRHLVTPPCCATLIDASGTLGLRSTRRQLIVATFWLSISQQRPRSGHLSKEEFSMLLTQWGAPGRFSCEVLTSLHLMEHHQICDVKIEVVCFCGYPIIKSTMSWKGRYPAHRAHVKSWETNNQLFHDKKRLLDAPRQFPLSNQLKGSPPISVLACGWPALSQSWLQMEHYIPVSRLLRSFFVAVNIS